MVAWDRSDCFVVTAVSDHSLKVWNASNGQLIRVLTGEYLHCLLLNFFPKESK